CRSMPSRGAQRWRLGGGSLGSGEEKEAAGSGAAASVISQDYGPRSVWSNDHIGQKSCVIAYIRPHEFERVAAVAVHRKTCSFQRKGCEALKGPAIDRVAIDQRHNGLIAVIYSAGVSRDQVEAESVIPRVTPPTACQMNEPGPCKKTAWLKGSPVKGGGENTVSGPVRPAPTFKSGGRIEP